MLEELKISPKKIALLLMCTVVVLVAISITGQYFRDFFGDHELAEKIISKINLDEERNNLPTWYQSSSLLVCSLILFVIGHVRHAIKDRDAKFWWFLSFLFLFLSLDEAVSIHEQMTLPLRNAFNLEGIFFLSWVIPAVFALAILGAVYAGFLTRLPSRTRNLMIAAGALFVIGAVGIEMIGANYMFMLNDPPDIDRDFGYALITTTEEFFEMSGIVLFIYGLLSYLNGASTALATEAIGESRDHEKPETLICGVS